MASLRLAGASPVTSRPSIEIVPPLVSSSPAISRSSVDLPQPDGPTNTTNSPSSMSRSMLRNDGRRPEGFRHVLQRDLAHVSLPEFFFFAYFTAPKVRPRTSCFWLNQPMIRIGAMASVEAADSLAQNSPCGLENER